MLFKASLVAFSLVLLVHFSTSSYAVKECYECEYFSYNSSGNEACKDVTPDSTEFLVDCTKKYPNIKEWQCVKVSGRIEVEEENFNYIKRACIPGKNFETCAECKDTSAYQTPYGFITRGKHCACDDKDGCNGSSSLVVGFITLAACLLIVAKF